MNNENMFTLWITGISASGKTTLAKKIIKKLNSDHIYKNIILIDGDEIRQSIGFYKYNNLDREQIGILKAELAQKENTNGKIVIVTGIASKAKWRKDYRKIIDNYYEIYLKCSLEICSSRDFKGQYQKAQTGDIKNFAGVTDQYEEHELADLVIDTENTSVTDSTKILYSFINKIRKQT